MSENLSDYGRFQAGTSVSSGLQLPGGPHVNFSLVSRDVWATFTKYDTDGGSANQMYGPRVDELERWADLFRELAGAAQDMAREMRDRQAEASEWGF